MVKLSGLTKKLGKNLASLLLGGSVLFGALGSRSELVPISSHTSIVSCADLNNVTFPSQGRSVYVQSDNVHFNNHASKNSIVLLFRKWQSTNFSYVGGLTISPNSTNCYFANFNAKTNTWRGLLSGEIPTNGLNGASYWIGGHDLNGNGVVGTFDTHTKEIFFEPGEYLSPEKIQFVRMPAFPVGGVGPVSIASVNISGYEDKNENKVPDYYEMKYPAILDKPLGHDTDGDKVNDREEWESGTNPEDILDRFKIVSTTNTNNTFGFKWNSLEGRIYNVKAKNNLLDSNWSTVTNLVGTSSNLIYETEIALDKPQQFYSVDVSLSPDEIAP